MARIAIATSPEAFEKWSLREVTICDVPAQEHAAAAIVKALKFGKDEEEDDDDEKKGKKVEKKIFLTSVVDGHQHAIDTESFAHEGGHTSWESGPGEEGGHAHAWIRNNDGSLQIAMNEGHTHELLEEEPLTVLMREDISKSGAEGAQDEDPEPEEGQMPNSDPKGATPSEADQKIADLEKRLERATAMAALTDVEKAHMGTLDEAGQEEFLKADKEARKADLDRAEELAKAEDPVVYTAADGSEFRKSDDPRLVRMARERDEDRAIAKAAREEQETLQFEKAASTDFASLPGETRTKVELLRAVSRIEDGEVRKSVVDLLKANNSEMAKALERIGTTGEARSAPAEKLDALATEKAKKEGISFEKAYGQVMETDEGRKLYAEYEADRISRAVK